MNDKHRIGTLRAIADAFFEVSISYFPRFRREDRTYEQVEDKAIIGAILGALNGLKLPENPEQYLKLGRESLNEVKGLTEYQDQKVTRLLTIIAFLTALSGVLFSKFTDSYPLQPTMSHFSWCLGQVLVVLVYLGFGLFALSAVGGALVVFHATRTRFKYPDPEPRASGTAAARPKSYLFFPGIIEVRPQDWATAFLESGAAAAPGGASAVNSKLSTEYMKNYIIESYLVAAKVADKVRYLEPAQTLLAFAVRLLLVWILLFAITLAVVQPAPARALPVSGSSTPAAGSNPMR